MVMLHEEDCLTVQKVNGFAEAILQRGLILYFGQHVLQHMLVEMSHQHDVQHGLDLCFSHHVSCELQHVLLESCSQLESCQSCSKLKGHAGSSALRAQSKVMKLHVVRATCLISWTACIVQPLLNTPEFDCMLHTASCTARTAF